MTAGHEGERRLSNRFPIERELKFKGINKRNSHEFGQGKTINMSSKGILFTTDQVLNPGRKVDVSVNWPAQLDGKVGLKFVARGRVVRFAEGKAAIQIEQHEFRTLKNGSNGTA